jgi:hypothetical protein
MSDHGSKIPNPWILADHAKRQRPWRAVAGKSDGTAGSASGLEKRTGGNAGTALQADSTMREPGAAASESIDVERLDTP